MANFALPLATMRNQLNAQALHNVRVVQNEDCLDAKE